MNTPTLEVNQDKKICLDESVGKKVLDLLQKEEREEKKTLQDMLQKEESEEKKRLQDINISLESRNKLLKINIIDNTIIQKLKILIINYNNNLGKKQLKIINLLEDGICIDFKKGIIEIYRISYPFNCCLSTSGKEIIEEILFLLTDEQKNLFDFSDEYTFDNLIEVLGLSVKICFPVDFVKVIKPEKKKYSNGEDEKVNKTPSEKNKRLKEENKRLKEESKRLKEENKRLKEENKKLKEESKRLKEGESK